MKETFTNFTNNITTSIKNLTNARNEKRRIITEKRENLIEDNKIEEKTNLGKKKDITLKVVAIKFSELYETNIIPEFNKDLVRGKCLGTWVLKLSSKMYILFIDEIVAKNKNVARILIEDVTLFISGMQTTDVLDGRYDNITAILDKAYKIIYEESHLGTSYVNFRTYINDDTRLKNVIDDINSLADLKIKSYIETIDYLNIKRPWHANQVNLIKRNTVYRYIMIMKNANPHFKIKIVGEHAELIPTRLYKKQNV